MPVAITSGLLELIDLVDRKFHGPPLEPPTWSYRVVPVTIESTRWGGKDKRLMKSGFYVLLNGLIRCCPGLSERGAGGLPLRHFRTELRTPAVAGFAPDVAASV